MHGFTTVVVITPRCILLVVTSSHDLMKEMMIFHLVSRRLRLPSLTLSALSVHLNDRLAWSGAVLCVLIV